MRSGTSRVGLPYARRDFFSNTALPCSLFDLRLPRRVLTGVPVGSALHCSGLLSCVCPLSLCCRSFRSILPISNLASPVYRLLFLTSGFVISSNIFLTSGSSALGYFIVSYSWNGKGGCPNTSNIFDV